MTTEEPNFCPDCGAELETVQEDSRERSYCSSCDDIVYRNPKPAAGVIVRKGEDALLVKRGIEPSKGKWSIPAGFQEYDEPPEEAAARELEEETSVTVEPEELELFDTIFVDQPGRGRVQVTVYRISESEASGAPEAGDDAEEARFWSREEIQSNRGKMRDAYIEPVENALAARE